MPKKKLSAKEEIDLMNKSAERLSYVRGQIRSREERFKEETDALFVEERALREDLLVGLKMMGLSSVRTSSGDSYVLAKTHDFEISNPLAFETWARDNRCVTIDKRAAKQRLLASFKEGTLPEFAKPVDKETISVRSAKKEEEVSE